MAATESNPMDDDLYEFLEEVESEESLKFANDANKACLEALGDPRESGTGTYDRLLDFRQSDDRLPYTRWYGRSEDGEDILYNFWKDAKVG
mmetsp:Transcript_8201/g.19022  ORF Transcript_8201/g.19022 Transcript_8201/m.19022 type:complete len:91 (+) Transcript_8201:1-273(+)